MNSSLIPRASGARRRPARGFTLVELLVALLLSLLVAIAILKMQSKMAGQTMRISDSGVRDTQARAALDLITRDLTSAGFLMGGAQYYCDALITYNSAGSGYFIHHAVDSLAAVSGTTMNFAPSLTLNYPAGAASAVLTDVLVTSASTDSSQFNDQTNPIQKGTAASGASPLTTGVAPLAAASGLVAGHAAIVRAPIKSAAACLRVPITSVTANTMTSAAGTTMPSNFYTGFVSQVASAGFPDVLTNASIFNARVVDIGAASGVAPAISPQLINVYYVDGSGAYPVLMRAQYSLVDDSVIASPQPIAAGVVALRTSYGVDVGNTGGVTTYETSAQVTANSHWANIRSVRIALVTRTINDDPGSDNAGIAYSAPLSIPIGPASAASAWFSPLAVPASTHHRYMVNTTEVAYRNWLWKN